jgi:hypothetical protein
MTFISPQHCFASAPTNRIPSIYPDQGAIRRRPAGPGFHVAEHRLFQLRIHFVRDGL